MRKHRFLIIGLIATLALATVSILASLQLTAEASPPGLDNNVIINALNNVLSAVTGVNHQVINLEPRSMLIDKDFDLDAKEFLTVHVVPFNSSQTISGHLSLAMYGSAGVELYARAEVISEGMVVVLGQADISDNAINVDFTGQGLDLFISNDNTFSSGISVAAVLQYTVSTDIVTLQ
jgi:hypothetical protein